MIVCSGCDSSSSSFSFSTSPFEQRAQRLDVELRVHLCAAELAVRRVELEAALQLAQLRRLQLAREARGADLGPDLAVLRDRPVGLLAPVGLGELDQPRAVQHAHVEVQVARVDREPRRELAVRQRLVRRAEHLQHLQPERMPERLQLLRLVDLEDVVRSASCSGVRHRSSLTAAASSR